MQVIQDTLIFIYMSLYWINIHLGTSDRSEINGEFREKLAIPIYRSTTLRVKTIVIIARSVVLTVGAPRKFRFERKPLIHLITGILSSPCSIKQAINSFIGSGISQQKKSRNSSLSMIYCIYYGVADNGTVSALYTAPAAFRDSDPV